MTPIFLMRAPTCHDGTCGIAANNEALSAMRIAIDDAISSGCGTVNALSPDGAQLVLAFIRDHRIGALRHMDAQSEGQGTTPSHYRDPVAVKALRHWVDQHLAGGSTQSWREHRLTRRGRPPTTD